MSGVLVLNASYQPLNIVSVRRAIVLLLKEKAELVEAAERTLHSAEEDYPWPLVIRLVTYVRIPHRLTLPLNRRNVFIRDGYTCQYCGRQPGRAHLTLDHLLPRSRGGTLKWENVVTACASCNQRKGDRLPDECGMTPLRAPFRPRYMVVALLSEARGHEMWSKYLL
ncbi:MAG: HNH endonuclease [Chloroflexota bacterium]|nr:HNH endonuclease [Chloroflexota bacterium]